ncbi:uncharacterized protein LOC126562266 [Anopheles maculipalpis]|uniref:uncharacterized protein LOC126562266 n=1 Tax=Anopheles maculipalpis TaxID=1496333 RepID=UPI002158C916|nr:uncharacterized protein LOC126562266 [Anopheles maculipalpis]XP_050074681.1 uncharacterized protein LOC126562266 [Anopheles maculipalpis]
MMPEEDEEMGPGRGSGADDSGGHQPEHQPLGQKHTTSRSASERSSYYSSTGSRDRGDYHRSGRDRDRSHRESRDHRDRNHRDRDHGGSGRHREHYRDRERDDYRDRRDRRSRSRSKESRSRDRDRDRHRSQRADDRGSRDDASRTERTVQDRLSAEIEQELANLRRQHDMKEALKKLQQHDEDDKKASHSGKDSQDESKPSNSRQRPALVGIHSRHFGKQNSSSFLPKNAPAQPVEYVPEIQTEEERIEFQRKMQEKLQQHLAAEGKLYPPPAKPQRDTPAPPVVMTGFANDGSFLEMFKKLQQQAATGGSSVATVAAPMLHPAVGTVAAAASVKPMMVPVALTKMPIAVQKPVSFSAISAPTAVTQIVKPSAIDKEPPPPPLPVFGRRRGGKILKTGLVKKVRPIEESSAEAPNDAWTLYLQEVKKYKSASCDADSKTRPLVK